MVQQIVMPQEDSRKNKVKVAVVGSILAATLTVGGALAYLTATDSITNNFSLDTNLSISLDEPSFVEANAQDLAPTQIVAKDPTITNDGSVDAYVAAVIKVPVFAGKIVGDDGKSVAVADRDLFSYDLGTGWKAYGESKLEDGYRVYTYVYDSELKAEAATSPVFDQVVTANLAANLDSNETQIDVIAYAIQSYGFSSASDAYAAYLNQEVEAVEVA